jgi:hypothetical protein
MDAQAARDAEVDVWSMYTWRQQVAGLIGAYCDTWTIGNGTKQAMTALLDSGVKQVEAAMAPAPAIMVPAAQSPDALDLFLEMLDEGMEMADVLDY